MLIKNHSWQILQNVHVTLLFFTMFHFYSSTCSHTQHEGIGSLTVWKEGMGVWKTVRRWGITLGPCSRVARSTQCSSSSLQIHQELLWKTQPVWVTCSLVSEAINTLIKVLQIHYLYFILWCDLTITHIWANTEREETLINTLELVFKNNRTIVLPLLVSEGSVLNLSGKKNTKRAHTSCRPRKPKAEHSLNRTYLCAVIGATAASFPLYWKETTA